ncbi:MAG: DNA helicase RecQ [Deltaproteobacteria bacterium]|nr:DNA helicase RecQ [Deltaproteobacteria bacterium]MBW2154714.1 DNA helicase RecQ [Deltaproteobacteria bacterium]
MEKAKHILKGVFGYDEFRSLQENIIENILLKKDTLVIMPTGGGKSLCYQIPALIFEGLTIVVSPLISLMKDQVEQLTEMGVAALFLNSSLSLTEYRRNVERIKKAETKLLYIAPETLLKPNLLEMLSTVEVDCLSIDEAHCISEWGHDFRPEYRQLIQVREHFPKAVCIALTATATPRVRKDIKASLGFDESNEFIASFDRENLFIHIVPKTTPLNQTVEFIKKFPDQSGIIYCFSRRQVEDLSEALSRKGFSVKPYHAGLSEMDRNKNQDLFIRDDIQIIVATIAFGMGINKPNVRFVVHYDLPQNLESYYQEIGRAGRDGLRSDCLLLFSYGDIQKIKHFINKKDDQEQRVANIHLNALLSFIETEICRRIPLLKYFGEDYPASACTMCDNCMIVKKDLVDITVPAQKFLSCVKRTGERFGAGHIIDVLRGSKAKKVLRFRHQYLSTYGIGLDYSKKQWFHISRQLIQKGLMSQDLEFGSLKLTEKAWDVLRGKENILGFIEDEWTEEAPEKETDLEHDRLLFDELRKKRKVLADDAHVPPYVIFSDKSLIEMATFYPHTKETFLDIHGVGTEKCAKYSSHFLNVIKEYCSEHNIKERPKKKPKAAAGISDTTRKKRHVVIGEAYNSGISIPGIMAYYKIKKTTVLDHLFNYLKEGNAVRSDGLLTLSSIPSDRRALVLETFEKFGAEFLKPAYEALCREIDYDELKILRLYYLCQKNPAAGPAFGRSFEKSFSKRIICLANSRKYSGRCIAGKEINGKEIGTWIRPVSRQGTGELSLKEMTFSDGGIPKVLDVISVPLTRPSPHTYQSENHMIDDRQWVKHGAVPIQALSGMVDDVPHLWINGHHSHRGLNDRIPLELAEQEVTSSLLLVRPENLCITVDEGADSLKKIRSRFIFNGVKYWLSVTDPEIETTYYNKEFGEYPIAEENVYICVSIGEPYEGYCYKLAAGIIYR